MNMVPVAANIVCLPSGLQERIVFTFEQVVYSRSDVKFVMNQVMGEMCLQPNNLTPTARLRYDGSLYIPIHTY